ncbi:MAG: GNAT family N-acetyltransferase [Acidimicrobiales bacterium]
MEAQIFTDPAEFLRTAASYIERESFSSSVIGVWATGVVAGARPHGDQDIWVTITDGGRMVGAAMHTPPFHLFLARMPVGAAAHLAGLLLDEERPVDGVNGVTEAVGAFAGVWAERKGVQSVVDTAMRLYYLDQLVPPSGVQGRARLAIDQDTSLVAEWSQAFHAEATANHPPSDPRADAERLVAEGLHLWTVEGRAVSMARRGQPVAGVSRVGPVYTPPEHRRQGYASAVTAAASQAALDEGARKVILYTDLSNPTSNAIYQSIGYVADHDAEERSFVPAARP